MLKLYIVTTRQRDFLVVGAGGDSYMHYVYHPPPFPPQENLLVSWWNIMICPCLFV